ncbi:MAG TPA: hypothetical protein VNL97_04925 [Solirubrobacterales bacterium]|nr:hypothetical protein [Solirubrobacterales bacterium]
MGLLLVAIVTAVALAGVGVASATVLCKKNEESCFRESAYSVPTAIEAEINKGDEPAVFKSAASVTCEEALIQGETTEKIEKEGAEDPLLGKVGVFEFGSCSECKTVEALNLPYKASLVPSATKGNGVLTLESSGAGKPSFKFSECAFGFTCTFGASKIEVKAVGGEAASLAVEEAPATYEKGSGELFCGKTATATQKYRIIGPPLPVFVSRDSILCEEATRPCPAGKKYPTQATTEIVLETGTKTEWKTSSVTIKCTGGTMTGKTTQMLGVPGTITPSFSGCENNCEVEVRNPPYTFWISYESPNLIGNGVFEILSMSVKLRCKDGGGNITFECQYAGKIKAQFFGGTPRAKFTLGEFEVPRNTGTEAECGVAAKWSGKFLFEEQKPLFVI